MAADLGQTSNPAALVPGDPASIWTTVRGLLDYAALLEKAGSGLASIDTTAGWQGAAADAFRKVYHGQPPKWSQAGRAFRAAATALSDHATVLGWAQQVAGDAITTWAAGPQYHDAAKTMLASARGQLAGAAAKAKDAVSAAAALAPAAPSPWSRIETGFTDAVDALASFGNAAIHDPGAVTAALGGVALADISAAGEGLGVALDATGVGTVAGVPLNVISAAGFAAGVTAAGAGLTKLAFDAAAVRPPPKWTQLSWIENYTGQKDRQKYKYTTTRDDS